jgi:hypothetical protein
VGTAEADGICRDGLARQPTPGLDFFGGMAGRMIGAALAHDLVA